LEALVHDPKANSNAISLADEEAVKKVLVDSVFGLWDVVNNLTRLRPSKKERYRVSIFGSARLQTDDFGYEDTKRVAAALAAMGCDIVTGGGPGLMQAANEGAASVPGGAKSIGIGIELPFEQSLNAFVSDAFEHRTFFTRLHQFVLQSDAFIVAPGGIGTVLEMTMIWQLLQVGHLQDSPLILVGKMWPGMIEWAQKSMLGTQPPLASSKDFQLPYCAPDGDAAIARIREHHARWMKENKPSVG